MTRINTNVSSLIAQTNLSRANNSLNTSLTRLSTGLRINSGADDPAGLIAAQDLQSDIIGVQAGISNSQQANSVIATADSALGQVSTLLDNIRGLVSQSANTGALSTAQIQANQLQVDSSLQAIDRIASSTTFGGENLLDGSLNFVTTSAGTVSTAATGTVGAQTAVAATGTVGSGTSAVTLTAVTPGTTANSYTVQIQSSASGAVSAGAAIAVTFSGAGSGGVTVSVASGSTATAADVASAINANANAAAVFTAAGGVGNVATGTSGTTSGGLDSNTFTLTAVNAGTSANGLTVTVTSGATAGSETAAYNASTNTLTLAIATGATSAAQIASVINATSAVAAQFTASAGGAGDVVSGSTLNATSGGTAVNNISDLQINQANFGTQSSVNVAVTIDKQATQGQLTYSGGTLNSALVLQVGGNSGYNVFNFGAGTTTAQIKTAVNAVSDATGVTATTDVSGNLTFSSQNYGSQSFASVQALSGTFATNTTAGAASTRSTGTDVQARINGIVANGDGTSVSLDTPTLNLNFSVASTLANNSTFNFAITGGGANFQLGPDVNTNQQARLGIQSVDTAHLGGADGTLYELQSGGTLSLTNDVEGAGNVVNEAIDQVTSLSGRLGAFQQTTLQTNINTLQDTLSNLTSAQSSIQDTDFAAESASLTRAQILTQSATTVLQIANHNPVNVLSLLQGATSL
jgi:flagellin